jgi:hypothetical protein
MSPTIERNRMILRSFEPVNLFVAMVRDALAALGLLTMRAVGG